MQECKGYCDQYVQLTHPNKKQFEFEGFYEMGGKKCTTCDKYYFPYPFSKCECCKSKLKTRSHG
jgi:hypothetical protein